MTTQQDIEAKFWKALKSDMTVMLGLAGVEEGHAQPMTTQLEGEGRGPLWFFTTKDNGIVQAMREGTQAMAQFVSKGHDLFASIQGSLTIDTNRSTIERLWNPHVAAWFEGGKEDPKLQLIRFDADRAEVWLNESSLFAGVKMLFGADPKEEYKDKMTTLAFT